MAVVAEGVESGEVAELLNEYGCDFVQGFHYSMPVSPQDIESRWLETTATLG